MNAILRALGLGAPWTVASVLWPLPAVAQTVPGGSPPADTAALVAAPKGPAKAPAADTSVPNALHASASAGGQFQTGNSHLYAATGQGKFDIRRGDDAFAAGVIGNYAETLVTPPAGAPGAPAAPAAWTRSTENLQGRLRYDRFLTRDFSLYLQLTGLHDSFQAITFRLNVDPGVKLIVAHDTATTLWGEIGYDFQFDDHFVNSLGIEQAGAGGPALDANNVPFLISDSDTIHSSRLFVGFQHAFNRDVQLGAGLEYLQGFGGTGANPPAPPRGYGVCPTPATPPAGTTCIDPVAFSVTAARLNFDTLLAANVGSGFSFGIGISLKYNGSPLAGKVDLDTAETLNLIYAYSSAPPKSPPPAESPPPPPPAAAPAAIAPSPGPPSAPTAPPAPAAPAAP